MPRTRRSNARLEPSQAYADPAAVVRAANRENRNGSQPCWGRLPAQELVIGTPELCPELASFWNAFSKS